MPDSRNGFGGLARQIRPEVERPNFGNQVGRPLLIGLVILTALNAVAIGGAILCAWLIGPLSGVLLLSAVVVYGLRVNSWWPLELDWSARGRPHSRALKYLLAFAVALMVLYLTDNWPRLVADPSEHRFLWYLWQYEAGRVYLSRAAGWVELRWLQWLRWATVALIPLTLPKTLKLLWYRFSVSTVYPTWDDSVSAQGRRIEDPLGLLRIDNTKSETEAAQTTSAPQARTHGAL